MYVCTFVCVCICVYVCMSVDTCICLYINVCISVYMSMCVRSAECLCSDSSASESRPASLKDSHCCEGLLFPINQSFFCVLSLNLLSL